MSLTEYRRKRQFDKTREPAPGKPLPKGERPIFVVQLHHASRRHYDFRLQVGDALKSWAVPKGPSYDPKVKRMAVEVEDHPVSYASFEGDIPHGEYGGGHVALFDHGVWSTPYDPEAQLAKGHLRFELFGEKLKGEWHLVRSGKAARQPTWLLFKEKDAYAGPVEADELLDDVTPPPGAPKKRQKDREENRKSCPQATPQSRLGREGFEAPRREEGHAPQRSLRTPTRETRRHRAQRRAMDPRSEVGRLPPRGDDGRRQGAHLVAQRHRMDGEGAGVARGARSPGRAKCGLRRRTHRGPRHAGGFQPAAGHAVGRTTRRVVVRAVRPAAPGRRGSAKGTAGRTQGVARRPAVHADPTSPTARTSPATKATPHSRSRRSSNSKGSSPSARKARTTRGAATTGARRSAWTPTSLPSSAPRRGKARARASVRCCSRGPIRSTAGRTPAASARASPAN